MKGIFSTSILSKRIKRRDFLIAAALGVLGGGVVPQALAQNLNIIPSTPAGINDDDIKDYLSKLKNFDKPHKDDIIISGADYGILRSTVKRLFRLQSYMGHGYFYTLSFTGGIYMSGKDPAVGKFPASEIEFLEKIFYADAANYGFLGHKPIQNINLRINRKEIVRDSLTGSYLYKGAPVETFKKIKRILGDNVILTSGVRGLMKQFLLFLNKVYRNNGNVSLASRSIAPPGYSFHGIGDFDVGQAGFGSENFTSRFTLSEVYKKLSDLGYLKLRYTENNMLGVRYEPWHIKISA
ncbi:MAG TPA: peptidase M15 [Nitrospirae bacterium]|nr:peptidase M15 [Nitrospirota bacterium]